MYGPKLFSRQNMIRLIGELEMNKVLVTGANGFIGLREIYLMAKMN